MMCNTVLQGKCIANGRNDAQSGSSAATLFIGHTNSTIINRIGVPITGIEQVKNLFGKVKPAVGIKIFGMVASQGYLEFTPCS
jgi:hypothetical protein